jgi:hypothetical protein
LYRALGSTIFSYTSGDVEQDPQGHVVVEAGLMLNDDHKMLSHGEGEVVDAVHVEDIPEGGDDDEGLGVAFQAGEGGVEFPDLVLGVEEGGEDAAFMFTVCFHSNTSVSRIRRRMSPCSLVTEGRRKNALVQ